MQQKMQSLRVEADEHAAKSEELKAKVKVLEQENLAKEQEITSLTHRNQLLEGEVEKLETNLKDAKGLANDSAQAGQQTEALQRRLQVLEEEAEQADKTLKETTEKYTSPATTVVFVLTSAADFDRQMSSPAITSERCRHSSENETTGRRSMRKCPRNMRS